MRSALAFTLLLSACGGDLSGDYGGGPGGEGGGGGSSGTGQGQTGILTAGEIDDNKNFEHLQLLLDSTFATYATGAPLDLYERIPIAVTDLEGGPLSNAHVVVTSGERRVSLPTGTDGRVLLFPAIDGVALDGATLEVTAGGHTFTTAMPQDGAVKLAVAASSAPPDALDLAFVVDATGSMGDEMEFLKAEVGNIVAKVTAARPTASLRFALIVYRDHGDAYVTRTFDFTTDLGRFQRDLSAQDAGGGGDYPEAADAAMKVAAEQLAWRDGNVARVLFHIADAPPHGAAGDARLLASALTMRARGIRVFPIAASGVGLEAEYVMRLASLVTYGRYLFLTDDSGVGNPHELPRIPCYQVQHLDDLLARTIASELAGAYVAAPTEEVLYTVGNYATGACLADEPETANLDASRDARLRVRP